MDATTRAILIQERDEAEQRLKDLQILFAKGKVDQATVKEAHDRLDYAEEAFSKRPNFVLVHNGSQRPRMEENVDPFLRDV